MKLIFALTAATFAFGAISVEAEQTLFNPNPTFAQSGQWYVAPNGCSYTRTQAPGEGVVWMLIPNPHHMHDIGGKRASASCPRMLRG